MIEHARGIDCFTQADWIKARMRSQKRRTCNDLTGFGEQEIAREVSEISISEPD